MDLAIQELFKEIGALTQATGRRIASPKNDPEDVRELVQTLDHLKTALTHTNEAWLTSMGVNW